MNHKNRRTVYFAVAVASIAWGSGSIARAADTQNFHVLEAKIDDVHSALKSGQLRFTASSDCGGV